MFTCPMRHAPLCRPSRSACSKPLYQERRHDQAVLSHRRWMALAATGGGDVQQYTFGAPAAPTEIWQEFEREARSAFVEETSSEDCDIVMAALQLAAEDDAVSTRSTVPLPVDSYSKRLDTIVRESRARLQQAGPDASPEEQLGVVCDFFYGTLGYKAATGVLELYSPYRVYMHNVLAQKCGTTAALGVLVWGLLFRLRSCGAIAFDFQVGLPPEGHEPVTRVAGPSGAVQGTDLGATSSPFVRWLQPREMLLETLLILKRSYWAWNWPKGAPSCFVPPAEAFLGTYGRAGQSSEVVGVMQPTGRPFGNLHLALRATERLAVLLGGAQGGLRGAQELRDMAVLLCHLNRNGDSERAASLLQEYQQFLIGANLLPGDHDAETASPLLLLKDAEGRSVTRTEVRLLMEIQKKLDQLKLEACFQAPPAAKESA